MKKKIIRSVIVSVLLLTLVVVPIFARYNYIANLSSGLEISASGRAKCDGGFTLWYSTHTCTLTIDLQMNDGGWGSLKTWVVNAEDVANITKYYYVTSGHYYKVVVTADVYDASGNFIETQSVTSSTVYY